MKAILYKTILKQPRSAIFGYDKATGQMIVIGYCKERFRLAWICKLTYVRRQYFIGWVPNMSKIQAMNRAIEFVARDQKEISSRLEGMKEIKI